MFERVWEKVELDTVGQKTITRSDGVLTQPVSFITISEETQHLFRVPILVVMVYTHKAVLMEKPRLLSVDLFRASA